MHDCRTSNALPLWGVITWYFQELPMNTLSRILLIIDGQNVKWCFVIGNFIHFHSNTDTCHIDRHTRSAGSVRADGWTTTTLSIDQRRQTSTIGFNNLHSWEKWCTGFLLSIVRKTLAGNHMIRKSASIWSDNETADNETGFKHMLFGSTDMQLFRMSPHPVWIFKPPPTRNLKNIPLAVDVLPYDDERNSLADKILL